jgi:hypothetical protein
MLIDGAAAAARQSSDHLKTSCVFRRWDFYLIAGIWLYEETKSPHFLRDVLKFLEVDPDFAVERTKRYMEPQISRSLRVNAALQSLGIRKALRAAIPTASSRPASQPGLYEEELDTDSAGRARDVGRVLS